MSASLLNVASQPGAQPGAAQGIAQQGAQAQQAQGPMAGFEALLAALFGDQGAGASDPAAIAAANAALLAGGKTAGKGLLGGKIVSDGTKGQVKDGAADAKAADAKAAAAAAAGATADAAALALLAAAPTASTTVQTPTPAGEAAAAQTGAGQTGAGQTAAVAAALAKLATAASATGAATAKDAAALTAAQTAKAQAAAAASAPQLTGADGQPVAAPAPTVLPPVTPTVLAQATQQATAAQAAAAEQAPAPAAPAPGVSVKAAAKSARVEGARAEGGPAAAPAAGKAGDLNVALAASAASAGKDAAGEQPALPEAARDAKPQMVDGQPAATDFTTASTTTPATLLHAAAVAVRGAPQTVANLAAQIAKKLDARSSRFDVQLDPAGLGKVDVRMEIAASGKMSAALTFDTPQAAAELRARAGELQKALEQAGFDLTGGMSFDVAADRGQGGRGQDHGGDNAPQFRGRAFQTALDTSSDIAVATPLTFRRASPAGVDVRI